MNVDFVPFIRGVRGLRKPRPELAVYLRPCSVIIRAVYTRENKPRLTLAAAYVSRERNYLYEYKLPGQDKTRLEKAVNVDFVPFIRGVRGLCKPRLELAAAYFLSYKRPYCLMFSCSFVFLCVTSSASFTGFYTEHELKFWCFFLRRGETGENLSVHSREPTNSTHI